MNWISTPLGIHILLNLNGKHAGKCFKVSKVLIHKKEFLIKNKLFQFVSDGKKFLLDTKSQFNLEKEIFTSSQESSAAVKNWINQYGDFQFEPEKYNYPEAKALLTNVCMYKGAWKSSMVKVHNSFSYTEDIKYEVRMLVVSICDDVSFAIVVPNETDVLCHLVQKLHEEGLSAALTTIQPAFTATCKQNLPTFQFNSSIVLRVPPDAKTTISQYGCVTVDQTGIDIKVLSCLLVGKGSNFDSNCPQISNDCFSFALIYKDWPIFTGQVLP
ncbi:PREDICTED: uncharacterized protein LOC106114537 isoform X2 [Papilio xuthus]|uniref:Uncharacterized protein LOC106114537 isoform X2 n=1 Tax=Papilio xuthus TaxID=66420 RepID=A0AAJ6Z1R1_PAPXU|nr:PREDICTED: uncharacterized protein LOC106114537 isoform X2 [Papilio xuthus]